MAPRLRLDPFHPITSMKKRISLTCLSLSLLLAGCGGEQQAVNSGTQSKFAAQIQNNKNVTQFDKPRSAYLIEKSGAGYRVVELATLENPVLVPAGQTLRFTDSSLRMDVDGTAGKIYRLYQAAFNREPDSGGLAMWINAADQGWTMDAIAQEFINSAEFKKMYGEKPGNTELVKKIYQNVLHRDGDPGGITFWTNVLQNTKLSTVLLGFSESRENQDGVAARIASGIKLAENGVKYVITPNLITGNNQGDSKPNDIRGWQPPSHKVPSSGNYVFLEGSTEEPIGKGHDRLYGHNNTYLRFDSSLGMVSIGVAGAQNWLGQFVMPQGMPKLVKGDYLNLQLYPNQDAGKAAMSWGGEGRSCSKASSSFVVDEVSYAQGAIVSLDLRFEQYCDGAVNPLRGKVHWDASAASDPVISVPDTPPQQAHISWQPKVELPASGNYLYLEGAEGEWLANGASYFYVDRDAEFSVNFSGGLLAVDVKGKQSWSGLFMPKFGHSLHGPSSYTGLRRYPYHDTEKGGMYWAGNDRACVNLSGWFAIDTLTHNADGYQTLEMRFEQSCNGKAPIRGKLRWKGYAYGSLWSPANRNLPTTGKFVYLESTSGDYIGQGQSEVYQTLNVKEENGLLDVQTGNWRGFFKLPAGQSKFTAGLYQNMTRHGFHDPAFGGLSWTGNGRACNESYGWMAVDFAEYEGAVLKKIGLRFQQTCESANRAPLHGLVQWRAN